MVWSGESQIYFGKYHLRCSDLRECAAEASGRSHAEAEGRRAAAVHRGGLAH